MSTALLDPPPTGTSRAAGGRGDALAVVCGMALVVAAAVVGLWLLRNGTNHLLAFPPLLAAWAPHVGPGSLLAVLVAAAVVLSGPALAARLPWRRLLGLGWLAAVAWTLSLALVDGWRDGVVARLTSTEEYLHDVGRVTDIPTMLASFADHILTDRPGFWSTHVGAHPPGALLTFVWLDRLGMGGGGPSGLVVIAVGASACVAVAVTVRVLAGEDLARRVLPYGVLLPGAVWAGVSADGMFAAVLTWGVALLAIGATGHNRGRSADVAALAGGLLLGWCLFLSYGLVLGGLLPLAVLVATRAWRAFGLASTGVAVVAATFAVAGFSWFTGYQRVTVIYDLSIATARPYWFFVWANLAALTFVVGPAVLAGLRRVAVHPRALPVGATLLLAGVVLAVVVADLSGLSKGEVERIWLPFAVWLVLPCALLPRPRLWLAAQAGLALLVNHLLFTIW